MSNLHKVTVIIYDVMSVVYLLLANQAWHPSGVGLGREPIRLIKSYPKIMIPMEPGLFAIENVSSCSW